MLTRRIFLRNAGLAMVGVGTAPIWLERALYAGDASGSRRKILVTIFQRGAADGLNIVVPHGEKRYYQMRPTIAVPRPSSSDPKNSAVDLDGFFGLHPSLAPLQPLFAAQHLAFVHAAGSPDPTRSHFDAQDYMESGTPGFKATSDGWLNRALPAAQGPASPVRAVSMGPLLPRSMRGRNNAVAIENLSSFQVRNDGASRADRRNHRGVSCRGPTGQPVARKSVVVAPAHRGRPNPHQQARRFRNQHCLRRPVALGSDRRTRIDAAGPHSSGDAGRNSPRPTKDRRCVG